MNYKRGDTGHQNVLNMINSCLRSQVGVASHITRTCKNQRTTHVSTCIFVINIFPTVLFNANTSEPKKWETHIQL